MGKLKLDLARLKERCVAEVEDFRVEGEVRKGEHGEHIFIDRGAKILAVAHLDTVSDSKLFSVLHLDNGYWIMSRAVDDRLGAYIILDLLPQHGFKYDILLTVGEEKGQSTAKDFKTDKEYRWMFSFDRAGVDVVSYVYDCHDLDKRIRAAGGTPAKGAWSDIGELEHLGCKGVNWGTAYYNNHGTWASAHVGDCMEQVKSFGKFFNQNYKTTLPHKKNVYTPVIIHPTKPYTSPYQSTPLIGGGNGNKDYQAMESRYFTRRKYYYQWTYCSGCGMSVNDEHYDKIDHLCVWCMKGEVAKRVSCPNCGRVCGEGELTMDGGACTICYYKVDRDPNGNGAKGKPKAEEPQVLIACSFCDKLFPVDDLDDYGICKTCDAEAKARYGNDYGNFMGL